GLFEREPVFRRALEECDELLRQPLGESLLEALYGAGARDEALAETRLAQPAVFAVSHAWAELWASWGVTPDVLLGHSLGEYVAAQRAGVFSLEAALRLVARRGALMQQVPSGAMLALGISAARLAELLASEETELAAAVELAAENGPEAVVVSGPEAAISALAQRWAGRGIEGRRLRTSHAFHSAMMDPVLEAFGDEVSRHDLRPPAARVFSNLTGERLTAAEATSPEYWVRHLRHTVRFGPALENLLRQAGAGVLVEVGPGRSLSAIARRRVMDPRPGGGDERSAVRVVASMPRPATDSEAPAPRRVAAELWLAGGAVDWRRVRGASRRRVPLPATRFDDHRYWIRGTGSVARARDERLRLHRPTWRQAAAVAEDLHPKPRRWLVAASGPGLEDVLGPALAALGGTFRWLTPADADNDGGLSALLGADADEAASWGVLWLGAGWRAGLEAPERGEDLLRLVRALTRNREWVSQLVVLTRGQEEVLGDETPAPSAWMPRAAALALARAGIPTRSVDLPAPLPGAADAAGVPRGLGAALGLGLGADGERTALRGAYWWRAETQVVEPDEGDGVPVLRDGAAVLVTGAEDPAVQHLVQALADRHRLRLALISGPAEAETGEARADGPTAVENGIRQELGERAEVLWSGSIDGGSGEESDAALQRAVGEAAAALGGLDLWLHHPHPSPAGDLDDLETETALRTLETDARELHTLSEIARTHGVTAGVVLLDLALLGGDDPLTILRAEQVAQWARDRSADRRSGGEIGRWQTVVSPLAASDRAARDRWLELLHRALELGSEPVVYLAPTHPEDWFVTAPAETQSPAQDFRPATGAAYEPPIGDTEERLAAIWQELLGVSPIGRHDDFFELGGHSLLATQAVARIRRELGRELSLRALFDAPSVAALAAAMATGDGADDHPSPAPALVPVSREGNLPLSFAQQRLWFLDQLEPGSPVYNLPFGLRLLGRLEVAALRAAFSALVRRHEVLRTRFESLRGTPHQVIADSAPLAMPTVDLTALAPAVRELAARSLAMAEARRPFRLASDPLIRVLLLRLAADEHRLTVTLHHIASDGWSLGVVVREVGALYRALREGHAPTLPDLPVQYTDFAVWQREWLAGQRLESQLEHWRDRLADLGSIDLPTDRPRPAVLSPWGGEVRFVLPAELTRRLRTLARSRGATLFMVLLAGFQTLLHRLTSETDVTVGSPVAGRTRIETEGLIGFFV
ncbi:MAG: acyltransferase domain-containing protein, partial [Acidobacteria bacterium]|nr:acyltransferase domain-containing protein [Acidobacteriota bacterium]